MSAARDVDPEGFVEYKLVRLAERLRRRFDAALRPHGLTARQFSVLAVARSRPGVTSAELARAVLTTPQSMGAIIDQLENAGLLQPRPHRGRGLPSPMQLSAAGELVLSQAGAQVQRLDDETRQRLGDEYQHLLRIIDVLEERGDLSEAAARPPLAATPGGRDTT